MSNIHIRLQSSWANVRRHPPFIWSSLSMSKAYRQRGGQWCWKHTIQAALTSSAWPGFCFCAWATLTPGQLAQVPVLQSSSLKGEVDQCQKEHTDAYWPLCWTHKWRDDDGRHRGAAWSVEDKVGKWTEARSCLDTDRHDGGMGGKRRDVCTDEIKTLCKWRVDGKPECGPVLWGGWNYWLFCQLVRRIEELHKENRGMDGGMAQWVRTSLLFPGSVGLNWASVSCLTWI